MTETYEEVLKRLSISESSTELDSKVMEELLHKVGYHSAIVTCGIVYIEGKGTLEAPPISIHSISKLILKMFWKKE
jgi:hypothetical protein